MAQVTCERGFKPYTITIDTLGEHKSLTGFVKSRNDLYVREYAVACRTYGSPVHPTKTMYKYNELSWDDVILLRNLDGKLPNFK